MGTAASGAGPQGDGAAPQGDGAAAATTIGARAGLRAGSRAAGFASGSAGASASASAGAAAVLGVPPRTSYLRKRRSTPPDTSLRFDDARMRRFRVTAMLPVSACAVAPGASRRRNDPSASHASSAPSRRPSQGGLLTTTSGFAPSARVAASPRAKTTSRSTAARRAPSLARRSAPSCASLARICAGARGRARPRAAPRAASQASPSKSSQVVHAKRRGASEGGPAGPKPARIKPGATSRAMSAASTGSVPEPHMGSQSTAPAAAFAGQSARYSRPAATVVRSAALCATSPR